jgi:hypothetical protein
MSISFFVRKEKAGFLLKKCVTVMTRRHARACWLDGWYDV